MGGGKGGGGGGPTSTTQTLKTEPADIPSSCINSVVWWPKSASIKGFNEF